MWRARGRCDKCNTGLETLYSYNGMRICNLCLSEEQDKLTHEPRVNALEEYRRIVAATQNVGDDIEAADAGE